MSRRESNRDGPGRLGRVALASVVTVGVVFGAGTVLAKSGGFSELAEQLAELRTDVDELTREVETKRSRMKSRLRSIQRQRAGIERKIEKQKVRLKRLRKSMREHREKVQKRKAAADDLQPAVVRAIEILRKSVRRGPPFKKSKRLKQLDELETQMKQGMRSPQKTVSRLWQFVEDELRLGRENGMYSQVIELEGREVLADVARVGMVALYFKTEKGRVGYAARTDGGWTWRETESEKRAEQIKDLFGSFRKNIRVGFFELPNAIRGIRRPAKEER